MITSEVFEKAIVFAIEAHKGQKRKGNGAPYITHPFSVMSRIKQYKKSANLFLLGAAAVLHDTVEDCGVTIETIIKEFGLHVAALVSELTLDKAQYKRYGKKEYLTLEMIGMSSYALAIKLCDRLDNICDTDQMTNEFKDKYKKETQYILEQIKVRKLSPTHKKLIADIHKQLKKL